MLQPANPNPSVRRTAGFSLIELLVVLLILTVVIAIVIPSLKHFRNAARKSITTQTMAQLATTAAQFKLDKNRLPGYFSTRDVGSAENGAAGGLRFTGMENLLLDLAGGITSAAASSGSSCATAGPIITVGPTTSSRVNVDITRIGAASGGASGDVSRQYFKPDPKFFAKQCDNARDNGGGAHAAMPVLVDAWGSPMLAWVQDDVPLTGATFAAVDSSAARAKFFLASNVAFTNAQSLGKLQRNQVTDSLLGSGNSGSMANALSLHGLLESPNFQGQARGPIVFHSAGANGVYIGKDERGGKRISSPTGSSALGWGAGRDYFEEGDFDDFVRAAE